MAHTSRPDLLPSAPWQIDVLIPIIPIRTQEKEEGFSSSPKNADLCTRLQELFQSDSQCSACHKRLTECSCDKWCAFDSNTTFQPTKSLRQKLMQADRNLGDRLHSFRRGGSPFSGFSLQDTATDDLMGSFMSMLYLSWLCTPLFTQAFELQKKESEDPFCPLLKMLGAAHDRKAQLDIVRQLRTNYVNRDSTAQSSGQTSPADILRTLMGCFPPEYINEKLGVVETKSTSGGQLNNVTAQMIQIQGPGIHDLESILKGSSVNGSTWSVQGDFFWVEIGLDSHVDCAPEFNTATGKWYMLGFISRVTNDKETWIATVREHDTNAFFVLDHPTCQPKSYNMTYLGVQSPALALYGRKKTQPPAWLRQPAPSRPPGPQSRLFDLEALEKDGLVTGSVDDLLTHCECPQNLQNDLLKGIQKVLRKVLNGRQVSKQCVSAINLRSVQGWPMPHPNNVCLVYDSEGLSNSHAGDVRYTKDFGNVPLRTKARSPMLPGIRLMVYF